MSQSVAAKDVDENSMNVLQKSRDSSSTERDITKQVSNVSQGLKRKSTTSSIDTDDSTVFKKSFGIRKQEIQSDCFDNWWLIGIHFFTIFIAMYIAQMEAQATNVFVGYATSSYKQHSLMATINVIRSVVTASCLPAFARLSDLYGRFEVFWFGMVLRVVGLIVMSQAHDIQKYAGGAVVYGAGFAAARILLQISAQDATTLRYRLASNAVVGLPVIITTWTSGNVNNALLKQHDWKFGIAMWAFTVPLCCIPYGLSCLYVRFKASKTPEWKKVCEEERASQLELVGPREDYNLALQNSSKLKRVLAHLKMCYHFSTYKAKEAFIEADIIGCFFVVCIFGFILVPLTLAGGSSTKWARAAIIVPLVIGFLFIPIFILWEMKLAKTPLIPFPLLRDRGIWSGLGIGVMNTFASGIPGSYAYPVLLVGMNATTVVATRTPQFTMFTTSVTLPFIAIAVLKIKRTKALVLFGCAILFVSMGLFVHFRGDNDGIRDAYFRNGIAAAFVIEGFGNAFFMRPVGVSLQACTNFEYMASITAAFAALYNIGVACSRCVSGAIWTQKMYPMIVEKMEQLGVNSTLAKPAYQAPYEFIKQHHWGSTPRRAVVLAYADLQRQLSIVALCLLIPLLVLSFFLRDHKLENVRSFENVDDVEKGTNSAERCKATVIYTDDDDKIVNFFKKFANVKRSTTQGSV